MGNIENAYPKRKKKGKDKQNARKTAN